MPTLAASPHTAAIGLDELPTGVRALVERVHDDGADVDLVRRLVEIGFVPGEPVHVVAVGHPGREPLAVRVGRSTFALRRGEAQRVRVHVIRARA